MKSKITAVLLKTNRSLVSKKLFLLVLFTSLLITSSCDSSDNPIFCTQEVVPGLRVAVLDAANGQPLVDNVEVRAVDESYQETLELLPGLEYSFSGADERAGIYTLTITKPGYQTYTSPPIVVNRNVCHVITQSLTVNLQSN
ncbi:carboxypeptidase-like regulatory domain-containing protein [Flavobacterium sp. 25HG05S-40]|uniref:carboxypeptidase-like regulatory domain-containing protein n=1 Tax=Flavobacterium sp. 25HG05S-40 TaxID=3458682 RepID=UPI004043D89D